MEVLPQLREGLAELQAASLTRYGTATFYILSPDQQDSLLRAIETTPFFETMRYLTIAGMFTMPALGGNRNEVGWQLIGFEDRHVWQPPYGYYDADYMENGA